jgi:hypothetical protein
LLAISGFAAIYSDLHNVNFWKAVAEEWDQLLTSLSDKALSFIAAIGSLGSQGLRTSPRDMLRFQWKMATENALREHGIGKRDYFGGDFPDPPPGTTALLRAYAHSMMVDADAIFLAQYLFKRADAKDLKIPRSVKTFEETMRRYRKQGAP